LISQTDYVRLVEGRHLNRHGAPKHLGWYSR